MSLATRVGEILIREAQAPDDLEIGELLVDSFVEAYSRKMPEVVVDDERKKDLRSVAAKRKEAFVLVAEKKGRLIGTATVYPPAAPASKSWLPEAAELRYLAVSQRNRGEGVSSVLLESVETLARERAYPRITLHIRRGAAGVAGLYQKHGFRREPAGDRDLPTIYLEAYSKELAG